MGPWPCPCFSGPHSSAPTLFKALAEGSVVEGLSVRIGSRSSANSPAADPRLSLPALLSCPLGPSWGGELAKAAGHLVGDWGGAS